MVAGEVGSVSFETFPWGFLPGPIIYCSPIFIMTMKKPIQVKLGWGIEADAIQVLRSIPELGLELIDNRAFRSDAVVQYRDIKTPVAIETRKRVSSAAAHRFAHSAKRLDLPMVVVAGEMTGQAREILDEAGVGSVDGLGNVRLELPGLLMRITGTRRPRRPHVPTRLSGKSGLLAQAMLLDVERSWHISELAQRCAVSTGLVHRVLRRLEGEDVVETQGAGPNKTRRLSDPAALLDLWAEEHRDRPLRQPFFMLAQTSDQLIDSLCDGLESSGLDYALTGAAAAARIAPFLTNVPVAEVWLAGRADANAVGVELGATPVGSGPNMVFLQESNDGPLAFRAHDNHAWTVNVFRLYLDLRGDPRRGREQADLLRRQVIGF